MVAERSGGARPRLFQLDPNLIILFSAISIPVIILGSVLILGTVRSQMNELVGTQLLGGAANDTARHLDTYLLNSLATVSVIGTSQLIHEAVEASNRTYSGDPQEIERSLRVNDEVWVKSRGALRMAIDIVDAPASVHLREIQAIRPSYREILVTDRFGALVAATNISTDYYQADEAWWRDAYGDGDQGGVHFGDVKFDRSAGAYSLELAVPIREQDENHSEVTGVLKVLIGADEFLSVIGSVQRGTTGHALLVDSSDGTVIAGREVGDVMTRQYPAILQLKENLQRGTRTFIGQQPDGVWLTAFARMPQPSPAPYGNWTVVVQQLYDEINAPVQRATTSLVMLFIGVVVIVLLFSLYLHYLLVKPIREIDLREEMDRLTQAESNAAG